jgi:Leucine-rich repeat (LRR) protein
MTTRKEILKNPVAWWNSLDKAWKIILCKNYLMNVELIQKRKLKFKLWFGLDYFLNQYFGHDYTYNLELSEFELKELLNISCITCTEMPITNIEPVRYFTNLTQLYINKTAVSDLEPISNLLKLTDLDISETPVSSLSAVKRLSKLKKLYFRYTNVMQLDCIENLTALKELDMSSTPIKYVYFLKKETYPHLKTLFLEDTDIEELEFLKAMPNLQHLFLDNTNIISLYPLAHLQDLRLLRCNGTQISSFESLYDLKKIGYIQCIDTKIDDFYIKEFLLINKNKKCVVYTKTSQLIRIEAISDNHTEMIDKILEDERLEVMADIQDRKSLNMKKH